MKKIFFYILFTIPLFLSCEDNHEDYVSEVYPKESKQWGYFDGHIDNKYLNVTNKNYSLGRNPIFSIRQLIDESITMKSDSINYIYTEIILSEDISLGITLFKLSPKIRYASETPSLNCNEGYIKVLLKDETNNILSYTPLENHPFKIEIINIEWKSPLDPIVEVKISGNLFNVNNLNNSIAIEGVYGTR